MKALITGASSGIGKEMAIYLSELGYELFLAARSKEKLEELQKSLKTKTTIIVVDLSDEKKVKDLYMLVKSENIDLLINNAGFGLFGEFVETDLATEMKMIDVNIKAVHILTKVFLRDFEKRGKGRILNVASVSGLMSGGPLLDTYYATKSYIVDLTSSIAQELKTKKSNIKISALCPGPVDTNFNKVAGTKFNIKSLDAKYVARYGIDKMFQNKLIIIPGFSTRLGIFIARFLPRNLMLKITYMIQNKKRGK